MRSLTSVVNYFALFLFLSAFYLLIGCCVLCCTVLLGCGGDGRLSGALGRDGQSQSGAAPEAAQAAAANGGTAAVRLYVISGAVKLPVPMYEEINLNVRRVDISLAASVGNQGNGRGGAWIPIATPNRTINLLSFSRGAAQGLLQTLAEGITLPAGRYDGLRLILGDGNTIRLADGTLHDLFVPSGMEQGVVLSADISSSGGANGTSADICIDFDRSDAIEVTRASPTRFVLRPAVWNCTQLVTGSISGKIIEQKTGAAIAGAALFAETLDGSGQASIVRTAVSGPDGSYVLNLLPLGKSYYLATRPYVDGTIYGPACSTAIGLGEKTPTASQDLALSPAGGVFRLSGQISPVAGPTQSDQVLLRKQCVSEARGDAGKRPWLIVDMTLAQVDMAAREGYEFSAAPTGTYSLSSTRTTMQADGTSSVTATAQSPAFTATGTQPVTVNLGY
jgi:hypothetical protein